VDRHKPIVKIARTAVNTATISAAQLFARTAMPEPRSEVWDVQARIWS
jgi:hypothetical protein